MRPTLPLDTFKITLLGCIRFLDHFGGLYGNTLSPAARKRSDRALKAALQAFALQWMPNSESPLDPGDPLCKSSAETLNGEPLGSSSLLGVYTDAWFRARSILREAISVRSFRVVCAFFIFDGIAVPSKAYVTLNEPHLEHEFLSLGLRKLQELDRLVNQYCDNLGPFSQYGALAEASLSLVRWCGYIRETGAALTTDFQCTFPAPFFNSEPSTSGVSIPEGPFHHTLPYLDHNLPDICRKAAGDAFRIWREIANVKNSLPRLVDGAFNLPPGSFETISSAITAIEQFNHSFRPFINHCRENFSDLSIPSRISLVSLAMPWDLGVLVLADTVQVFAHGLCRYSHPALFSCIQSYGNEAASSVASTIGCMLLLPTEERFNLQNGLGAEVPIIAYHVTPGIMSATLERAVEHVVKLRLSSPGDSDDMLQDHQIDRLMKGLVSLDVTIGGSQTAGVAMQSLMHKYGDAISECWTCDFET
ncbi:uncharacterized protein N7482_007073 [Penicillium canariense]|uniref:Uncharacterized protein n=1 Tax=Penicillium canariense TaxID=189055 RepID=A0A9W9LJS9_9EURO|nr:uncharacterized protein N7482_007073 [Penicillium canariense]KAJ5160069.1 hypothetical protein N7482_007073 [Penicillium canariense]